MKKIKWLLIIFVLSFCACKKDSGKTGSSVYYIKASFNGSEQKFSYNASAKEFSGDYTAELIMTAKNDSGNRIISLYIQHQFARPVIKGTYLYPPTNYFFIPACDYTINDSIYTSGADTIARRLEITISDLTSTTISGTFNGKLNSADNVNDSLIITNGSFYLPYN